MEFFSILFKDAKKESETLSNANNDPGFFVDLNLNQVIDEIIKGKEEYHLEQFFYNNLHDIDSINYRLDIMRDLECKDLFNCMVDFSYQLKRMREYLSFSGDLHNHYQKEKWFLDAVYLYCNAVNDLRFRMSLAKIKSEGLLRFYKWLNEYENSEHFVALFSKTKELQTEFNRISYSIQVGKDEVIVSKDESNSDFCAEINKTLQKFSGVQLNYEIRFFTDLEMCALETKILEIIRKMNPSVFEMLDSFFKNNTDFLSNNIIKFDVEIQFYISYLDYINKLKQKGMHFAYPSISNNKALDIVDAYDLAFAQKSLVSHTEVVCNDFYLNNEERIYIITGPNQGGKTTFARAFGQIMFLSMLGCPVPCRKASIFIFDNIYTHFNKEEKLITDYGRLKEELNRLSKIIRNATKNSIIIINELFNSTTSYDAYIMGKKILDYFIKLDCVCLYVTHIFELASVDNKTVVSMVATVNDDEEASRTYKVVRKAADGVAYANSIVEKYGLGYKKVKERIISNEALSTVQKV